jgi:hypothetical protein
VCIDAELKVWKAYDNRGWPARYLWNQESELFSFHYGEGAYAETEREIQALLGVERDVLAPLRPEDAEGVLDEEVWELVRPDGTSRSIEIALRADFLPGRHIALMRDVTQRKALEAVLQGVG